MFDQLVGKAIQAAVLGIDPRHADAGEGTRLTFTTAEGDYVYDAFGDCCSESWIESTDPLEELAGATILRIEEAETQRVDGTRDEVDDIDFVTFVTTKGYWHLEFRNSSNGYYGGQMDLTHAPDASGS
jgi:hypothetical protein